MENSWGKVFWELFRQLTWKYRFYVLGAVSVFFLFELLVVVLTVLVTLSISGYGK